MTPKHLHSPISTRARCPVCHQSVYSRAGIHPQCAMAQADPPRPRGGTPKAPIPAVEAEAVVVIPIPIPIPDQPATTLAE